MYYPCEYSVGKKNSLAMASMSSMTAKVANRATQCFQRVTTKRRSSADAA